MCRRFVQKHSWSKVAELYALSKMPRNLEGRYNIAPTTTIDVVRLHRGRRELIPMRWGFLPTLSTRTAPESRVIFNARAETIIDDPMFRRAMRSRCIVPASGYYEWKTVNGAKQPFYLSAANGGVLLIAGLWDECSDGSGTGRPVLLCTLIVTAANGYTARIRHRMPVFLQPNNFASWLAGSAGPEVLTPAPNDLLRVWRVSTRVNSLGNDEDMSLIEPVGLPFPD
jgi:putative SOS response-associated peptidase YedK